MKTIQFLFFLIVSITFPHFAFGQLSWEKISVPGANFIMPTEKTNYSFSEDRGGSHGYSYLVKKSTDNFQTFSVVRSNSGSWGCYSIVAMQFIDADTGFIAENCQNHATFFKTTNGGLSWEKIEGIEYLSNLSMHFLSTRLYYHTFSWNGYSSLMKSGKPVYSTSRYKFGYLSKIKFINDSTGFIICSDSLNNAVILKTTNYGYQWIEVKTLSNSLFKDIITVSDSIGFVVGTNGIILKTSNYGQDWQTISGNTSNNLKSIDFTGDGTGYIVGDSGIILKSTDTGNTWTKINFINSNNLIYVRAFKNGHVYINDINGVLYNNNPEASANIINNYHVYPNPVTENLTISIPGNMEEFEMILTDLNGKLILSSKNNTINVKHLAQGFYIATIKSGGDIKHTKFIKH